MAPEYAMGGYLTEKADVYSFGIVVLELVSGKSNRDFTRMSDYICLLDWVSKSINPYFLHYLEIPPI